MTDRAEGAMAGQRGEPAVRVLFVIPSLVGGGAEGALVKYLRHIDRSRIQPELAVFNLRGPWLSELPADVPVHCLDKHSLLSFPLLAVRLSRLARRLRPELVVSFLWYADAVQLLAQRLGRRQWRSVVFLRGVTGHMQGERLGGVKRWVMREIYPRADACLAVSEGAAEDFVDQFQRRGRPPVWVQPNPWPIEDVRRRAVGQAPAWPPGDGPRLISIGRLSPDKGLDILLEALARIGDRLRAAPRLLVVGEGDERPRLEAMTRRLGIDDRVRFAGWVDNPYPALAAADLFVLSSRREGLPGALIESLILGCPAIATDCVAGPREILAGGRYGRLVPPNDARALALGIEELLRSPDEMQRFRSLSSDASERFAAQRVVRDFENRLTELARGLSQTRSA